jgi:transcriptional regulator with XRE-family HTH domain
MAIRAFPASTYVAAQTKNIRKQRRWSQQRLADRLNELVTGTPPEIYEEDDKRRRRAVVRARKRRWTQSRVAKLERGGLKPSVDDLLELALALDVSPLVLLTPMLEPKDTEENWALLSPEKNDVFKLLLGEDSDIAYWPRDVRRWIRGAKPLLSRSGYRTDADAMAGIHFYAVDSQPGESRLSSELQDDAKEGDELRRKWRPLKDMLEKAGDGE